MALLSGGSGGSVTWKGGLSQTLPLATLLCYMIPMWPYSCIVQSYKNETQQMDLVPGVSFPIQWVTYFSHSHCCWYSLWIQYHNNITPFPLPLEPSVDSMGDIFLTLSLPLALHVDPLGENISLSHCLWYSLWIQYRNNITPFPLPLVPSVDSMGGIFLTLSLPLALHVDPLGENISLSHCLWYSLWIQYHNNITPFPLPLEPSVDSMGDIFLTLSLPLALHVDPLGENISLSHCLWYSLWIQYRNNITPFPLPLVPSVDSMGDIFLTLSLPLALHVDPLGENIPLSHCLWYSLWIQYRNNITPFPLPLVPSVDSMGGIFLTLSLPLILHVDPLGENISLSHCLWYSLWIQYRNNITPFPLPLVRSVDSMGGIFLTLSLPLVLHVDPLGENISLSHCLWYPLVLHVDLLGENISFSHCLWYPLVLHVDPLGENISLSHCIWYPLVLHVDLLVVSTKVRAVRERPQPSLVDPKRASLDIDRHMTAPRRRPSPPPAVATLEFFVKLRAYSFAGGHLLLPLCRYQSTQFSLYKICKEREKNNEIKVKCGND
ncbi:hypothetical protein J6590_094912 [Homalodisca vitripennis]|nr:hypothetical protein J6590_094912 [Homalodisca vitripennis]